MAYDDPAITAKRYALLSDKALTDLAQNFNELTPTVDSGEDYQQPACPKCGSIDVMEDDADRKRNATGLLAGSFFPPMPLLVGAMNLAKSPTDLWKCNNCGCRWSDDVLPGPAPQ